MIDAWPILSACKSLYHKALAAAGHDGRACDQFGTLLACAWLLLNDELRMRTRCTSGRRCARRSGSRKCPMRSAMKRPASTGS
jgi:hypothetical protein